MRFEWAHCLQADEYGQAQPSRVEPARVSAPAVGVSRPGDACAGGGYHVGIQRTCWQIHSLTNWMGDAGFLKAATSQYRSHVYLGDVVRLGGRVESKEVDSER